MLIKLTILPFDDSQTIQAGPPSGPPFTAQFNPETYTDTTEVELAPTEPAHGDAGQEAKFKAIKPKQWTLDLLIDGTGYSPAPPPLGALDSAVPSSGLSVVAQIELFKQVTGFSGNVHRPRYLMLVWGKLVATCVLESFSVAYKLFTPEGLPLRAVISATFKEHKDSVQGELEKNLSSPDIQHAHVVRSGEHLTNVVQSVYKMPDHYISIAEANGLHTVRQVAAGSTLFLPPLR
ncbi:MAG TPA: hypothetical protein VKA18_01715 [Alphaproteobacteria bacterium]|nr:hypothetical protein [Alphaproteobacteria bacterium]